MNAALTGLPQSDGEQASDGFRNGKMSSSETVRNETTDASVQSSRASSVPRVSLVEIELSSALTPIYKYLLPFITFAGFIIGVALRQWLIVVPFAVAVAAAVMFAVQLKRVVLEDGDLVLIDLLKRCRISCATIGEVQESRVLNIRPAWIFFKVPTRFGHRIAFIPKLGSVPLWKSHPVVQLLRQAASSPPAERPAEAAGDDEPLTPS